MSEYVTDGFHLYEVLDSQQNFGLRGGRFLTVLNCVTNMCRTMTDLEAALCRPVGPRLH